MLWCESNKNDIIAQRVKLKMTKRQRVKEKYTCALIGKLTSVINSNLSVEFYNRQFFFTVCFHRSTVEENSRRNPV